MGESSGGDEEIIMTCKLLLCTHCWMVTLTQRINTRMGVGSGVFGGGVKGMMGGEVDYKFPFR